jgi:hypothetical protein
VADAEHRERTLAMFEQVHSTATNAAAAAERANLSAQQFALQLREVRRQRQRPALVDAMVNTGGDDDDRGGGGGAVALEAVPAQPPGRMELVPVVHEAVKRATSASAEAAAKWRPADEVAAREPRAVARLAIAAASGAAAGPESPGEVPSFSSAGPEYVKAEQLAAYSAAHRRLAVAFPGADISKVVEQVSRGRVDPGTALANLVLDQSGSRPTAPTLMEAAGRANLASSGQGRRLSEPNRRVTGKQPPRTRSRSGARAKA